MSTNLMKQTRLLFDPNGPNESFVKPQGREQDPPRRVAGRNTRLDMNWNGRRIEVQYAPDETETMVFYPTSNRMSVYLSRVWYRVTEAAELGDVLPYGAEGEPVQLHLPGWYQCQEIKPRKTWFTQTAAQYPRVPQSDNACGWGDLKLGSLGTNHFRKTAKGGPDQQDPLRGRIPQQLMLSRLTYCAEVMLFANRKLKRRVGNDPHYEPSKYMRWYWPREWTNATDYSPNLEALAKLRNCSHLCHNKFCVSRHHIVVEPLYVNRTRQNSSLRCPGYTVIARGNDSVDATSRVQVLSYSCIHQWGCRSITASRKRPSNPFAHNASVSGEPHRKDQLVYRDGKRFKRAKVVEIPP